MPVLWFKAGATVRVLIDLLGGPLDGMSKPLNDPPQLIWAANELGRLRIYRLPAPGRLPYEAEDASERSPRASYVFGGHRHFVCAGCGIYHAMRDSHGNAVARCHLCEHPVPWDFVQHAA